MKKFFELSKSIGVGIAVATLTIGFSVFATTIGTNISSGGTLTINGNSTFGDAATDVNLFTGTLQASTTALFTGAVTTYGNATFGDAAGDINLFTGTLQASTTALFTNGLTTYGNSTFGDAAGDVNIFTGTLQASTTALFTGAMTTYGDVTIGDASTDTLDINASTTLRNTRFGTSGATITGHLSASSTVDFASVTASSCNTQTVTVTGASPRDTVVLGLGDDLGGIASSTYKAWVSAANTVSIQLCLFAGAATTNPGGAALRVDVWQH